MGGSPECSCYTGPTSFASFGDIPGNLCSPTDDWPRPFRNLNHDAAWDHLAAASNLHSVKFDPTGRWRADALNFQPCAETPSQDRYAIQQIHIQGRVWTLSAVFDGHLGSHTVEHVAHHMPIIVREHLKLITRKHGDRVVPPPLIADMFSMAIRALDDAIANDVLELFPDGLSSLSRLSDLQIQEVLDDQLSGGQNYTKARLCLYGTTALVALVDPDHQNLWLANLGDCQGLMVSETDQKSWNVEVLTQFHNGENPLEVQRVMNEHPGEPECIVDSRVWETPPSNNHPSSPDVFSIIYILVSTTHKHSRLHYLSTWKAELKNLVQQAQEEVENWSIRESIGDTQDMAKSGGTNMSGAHFAARSPSKRKGKEKAPSLKRVMMHCDFDCFFVSVGLLSHPELRGKPVVVCHSQGSTGGASSTSEIASSSYEARSFGIKNGMRLCPDLMTIPYEFKKYKQLSLRFYTILMRHADDIQAVSVDEALIEVTTSVSRCAIRPSSLAFVDDPERSLAEQIQSEEQVAKVLRIDVIGIAENIQLARIATRKAKPAGSFHLKSEDVEQVLAPLDIDDLHGFGHSTRQKANEKLGVTNLGELAK
ncbi:hypothetical protein BDR07DRAFT_1484241 [Suillus spraguei]|nr:hypothetical protein BDR07DRAFT_1484241 [Suillus spraguei]